MTAGGAIIGVHESAPAPLSRPGADTERLVSMPAQSTPAGRPTADERFWAKVNKNGPVPAYRPDLGPCWIWTAATNGHGYGSFAHSSFATRSVHRISYELLVGPVPEGLELDHLCRVTSCVNPAYLEPVTHAENLRRSDSPSAKCARATHCKNGHPYSGDNLRIRACGRRECRACVRAAKRRRSFETWKRGIIVEPTVILDAGSVNEEDAYNDDTDKFDRRKIKVRCPGCGRESSPLCSPLTKRMDGGMRRVGLDHRELFVAYESVCGGCRRRYRFDTYTPQ